MHSEEWRSLIESEEAFRQKYWLVEQQEVREKCGGNFDLDRENITDYVVKLYNEAKYLNPAVELSSFGRTPTRQYTTFQEFYMAPCKILEKKMDIFCCILSLNAVFCDRLWKNLSKS